MLENIIYYGLNKQDKNILEFCLTEAGRVYGATENEIIMPGRCSNAVAFARQLAIYIACKSFSLTANQANRLFGLDRVAVRHALHHVELRRADPTLNAAIIAIEARINTNQKEELCQRASKLPARNHAIGDTGNENRTKLRKWS